ncbi:MAG: TolC family protein [Mediterranea sp.]|jgi:outer membrane protein TolC|nr:TolC family protein [Mediterranea sp.]
MQKNLFIVLTILLLVRSASHAQEGHTLVLTLPATIERAQGQSPDAAAARHTYRAAYWNYQYYRANYLPSLTLTSNPELNRAINSVTQPDGTIKFVRQDVLNSNLTLGITQNIPFTGGSLSVQTAAQRSDQLSNHTASWQTSPVNIIYQQDLFGYNSLRWDRRIEPVRYREAKKTYVETLELIAAEATKRFFDLATAQSNYEIASTNYANADTLYIYAQGRYNIGTITENEMLQLEVNKLSEETNLMNAQIALKDAIESLRSYLGIHEEMDLKVDIADSVPATQVPLDEALQLARQNSPDIENMHRRQLEGQSAVAQARANAGLKADIYLRFGLTQTGNKFKEAYERPLDQQRITLGITLPILDWGRGKGQVRVARSNRDLINTQVEQQKTDFEQNIRKLVMQFNLQARRVEVATRTDETAQRRADVARRLYLLGKSTVLDLNASITEKDKARRDHISALYNYWSLFYTLRSITLYDFEKNRELTPDLHSLIK